LIAIACVDVGSATARLVLVCIAVEDRRSFAVGVIVSRCVWNAVLVEMKSRAITVNTVKTGRIIVVLLGVSNCECKTVRDELRGNAIDFWGGALYVTAIAI